MFRHHLLSIALLVLTLAGLPGLGSDLAHGALNGSNSCSRKHSCSGPTRPAGLTAAAADVTAIAVKWSPSSASSGGSISGYRVDINQSQVAYVSGTDTVVNGLACGTNYGVSVTAVDSSGRVSSPAQTTGATSPCPPPAPVPAPTPSPTTTPALTIWNPAPHTTWQWQITGQVDESVPAQMFDVDLFDAQPGEINAGVIGRLHAKGAHIICYMDSGAWETYRPDAAQFPKSVIGNSTGWNGEYWLDIRPQSWPLFESIIINRMKLAAASGCDGIEPDQNNPVGNGSGFSITYADEKAWYLEIARDAHALGLSVGMKNGIEIVDSDLVNAFDWSLNEECFQYNECDALAQFVSAGKPVFQVEYQGDPSQFCTQANNDGFNSMKKRLLLDAWRVTCW